MIVRSIQLQKHLKSTMQKYYAFNIESSVCYRTSAARACLSFQNSSGARAARCAWPECFALRRCWWRNSLRVIKFVVHGRRYVSSPERIKSSHFLSFQGLLPKTHTCAAKASFKLWVLRTFTTGDRCSKGNPMPDPQRGRQLLARAVTAPGSQRPNKQEWSRH